MIDPLIAKSEKPSIDASDRDEPARTLENEIEDMARDYPLVAELLRKISKWHDK